ncbi:MAG: MASE3 domain-containing protein [Thermoplasmata archaeon]
MGSISNRKIFYYSVFIIISIMVLYLINLYNYLLFHSLVEIFSILVSFTIFIIAYNSRKYIKNNFFVFIGTGYLFIGLIDLIHTLGYKGMGVFSGYGSNLPTQLWISARFLEAFMLFFGLLLVSYDKKMSFKKIFAGFSTIFVLLMISIFFIPVFPDCYIDGSGLTLFKKSSEYLISIILVLALYILYKNKKVFSRYLYLLLSVSITLTILSEISFTFYVGVYDFSNMIGHIFKLISFILIYESLISTGIRKPFSVLFKDIKDKEEKLEDDLEKIKKNEKKIEELKEEYEMIFNNTQDAMFLVEIDDHDFRYIRLNSAHEEMSGLKTSEIKGKRPYEVLDSDSAEKIIKRYKECVDKKESISYEEELELPSGKRTWSTKLTPIVVDGNVELIVGSSRDITERKKIEERDEFLQSLLRHDLKNKLLIAEGYLDLLEGAEIEDEYRDYLKRSREVYESSVSIIEKVRKLNKAQEDEIKDIDIDEVIKEILEESKGEYNDIEINYKEDMKGCKVKGGDLLKTVFTNLIENALKHSDCNEIRIRNEHLEDFCVTIVEDNGKGISDQDKEKRFEKGYKKGETAGTGLGLYLIKVIVKNYGGDVEVKDSELGGARFDVILKKVIDE